MNRRKKINSSEDKYRYIFEYANEAILVVQDGLLKLFNPKLTEATGYSEEEIKDKPFIEFIHKDDREMVSDYYQRRLKGEEIPEVYPFRIIDKNGDTKWIEIHAVLIDWEDKPATLSFLDDITERKKAEDELLIEQDFKKSLMDITPAFFVVIDAEFKILMMNKSMLNALGYKENEVIGINYLSTFIPKNEYKQVTKVLQRCLSGELTSIENHIIAKDSRMLLVEWHGCPIRDLNNKVESFFGVGIDITERGQIEEAYRSVVDHSLQGLLINQGGRIVFANQNTADISGYTINELLSLSTEEVQNLIHPEDRTTIWERAQKRLAGEQVSNRFEFRFIRKDGKVKWVEQYANSIVYQGKSATQVSYIDITDRKKTEKELVESERKFRALYENANDAIFIVEDAVVVDCNPKTLEIFGCKYEDIIGKTPADFSPPLQPDGSKTINKVLEKVKVTLAGKNQFLEMQHSRLDGTIFDAEVSLSRIEIGGKPIIQGIVRDITERKKAEAARKELEAQLIQSQKMEAVGTLAGGIAHDFNNLLTVIMGYSQMLLGGLQKEDPTYNEINEIGKAGERAAALTRQLLTFSRQQKFYLHITDLNVIVTNSEKMLRRVIPENIAIDIKLEPEIGNVRVDSGQIDQVIMNLAVNARDAMPKGGKLVIQTQSCTIDEEYIKSNPDAKVGNYVCLSIEDTGTGMSKETIGHIFEPFYTTKGVDKGTGLGLSVVFGIIKQHDGWVNVYSEPGQGTSFKIYIPVVKEEKERKTKESLKGPKGKGEVILVVEDESGVLAYTKKVLAKNNYRVLTASTASEAIKVFDKEKGKIDLVFSDIVLPDINGIELMDKLRPKALKLRFLMASGYTEKDENVSKRLEEDEINYIQKPYSIAPLLKAIRGALA